MSPTLTPQAFVAKWRSSTFRENAAYVEHFIDLCQLVGHPTPATVDSQGTTFTFQAGVQKQSGKQGWADVFKRGFFAVEYKGKHADLAKAYAQLLQYREALENSPLLIVSDMERLVVHTNFTNTAKQVYTIALDDLLTPACSACAICSTTPTPSRRPRRRRRSPKAPRRSSRACPSRCVNGARIRTAPRTS